jgi:hypothetical protein
MSQVVDIEEALGEWPATEVRGLSICHVKRRGRIRIEIKTTPCSKGWGHLIAMMTFLLRG